MKFTTRLNIQLRFDNCMQMNIKNYGFLKALFGPWQDQREGNYFKT